MQEDWVSPWWQALTVPPAWDVCGVPVPRLSVWHVFALENIGNAYLYPDSAPDMDDAASLLLFASRDMAGGLRLLHGSRRRERAMVRLAKRLSRLPPEGVHAACLEYASTCLRHGHRMKANGGGGSPAGTPESWAIVSVLISGATSWEDAWNMPYSQGRAVLDAWDERNGNAVMTPALYGEEMVDNWDHYEKMEGTRVVALN